MTMFSKNKKTILSGLMGAVIVGMVFGFGNFMQPATAGFSGPPCEISEGEIVFYDKILFTSTKKYVSQDFPTVNPGQPYDVIVPASFFRVMDPRAEVLVVLNEFSYQTPNGNQPAIWAIKILDVDVATACLSFGFES